MAKAGVTQVCACKKEEGVVVSSNKISGKGAYTTRGATITHRAVPGVSAAVREGFWGQVRWRTQHALEEMLDADSEQQMAEEGLARYERRNLRSG
jgi:hypothetical protein